MWFWITTNTFVFAVATSEFSGSPEISIAFSGKEVVVAPVATSSSAPDIPVTVLPEDVYTISKFPNRSATGKVSSACTSKTTLGSSITLAIISEAEILPG